MTPFKKCWNIARLSIRGAFRSRLILLVLALLLLAIIGLPLTIRDNGTIAGRVQIILSYTLGFTTVLLSIVSVWWGATGISREIADQQIHLILTKPVHRVQIWLGKWLGLLIFNACLLMISGGVIYTQLLWNTRMKVNTPEEEKTLKEHILVSRRIVKPLKIDVEKEARDLLKNKRNPNIPIKNQLRQLIQSLLIQKNAVPPGHKKTWSFTFPSSPPAGLPIQLGYRFSVSDNLLRKVQGEWLFYTEPQVDTSQKPVQHIPGGLQTLQIPPHIIKDKLSLQVAYHNTAQRPVTLLFDPNSGPSLMYYNDTFEFNFIRTLLILFAQLSFFSAIGVTAGSLFSTPVASFVSFSIIAMQQFSNFIQARAEKISLSVETNSFTDEMLNNIYYFLNLMVHPLRDVPVLENLSNGIMIPWSTVSYTLLAKILIYSTILGIGGCWFFNRREIALPE